MLARNAVPPRLLGGRVGVRRRRPAAPDPGRRPDSRSSAGHASAANPAALGSPRAWAAAREGAALDPSAAIQDTASRLPAGAGEVEVTLPAGRGRRPSTTAREADPLATGSRAAPVPGDAPPKSRSRWDELLGTVQVHTPDPADGPAGSTDWLLYQVLELPVLGAGRRLLSVGRGLRVPRPAPGRRWPWSTPRRNRRARPASSARPSRQFVEGDVQHWWHPPVWQGCIRTRICRRPALAARIVASYYVDHDRRYVAILDQPVPYLQAPAAEARPGGRLRASRPSPTPTGTLYEHCLRALDRVDRQEGRRPTACRLMGTGDWNDGMNRVGGRRPGRERLELAWFADQRPSKEFAQDRRVARRLRPRRRLPAGSGRGPPRVRSRPNAWDGDWYRRRAYFDDGTPLGSSPGTTDCRIDSIAQSWAAMLADAAQPERARQGHASPPTNSSFDRRGPA